MQLVYLALGGNIGDTAQIFHGVLERLKAHPHIADVRCSRFLVTAPVSPIPQDNFLNAAVSLRTSLSVFALFSFLQEIEKNFGKVPKPKEAPRPIDIDILLFGHEFYATAELTIPHPKWKERSFVLIPLSDLTESVVYPVDDRGGVEVLKLKKDKKEKKEKIGHGHGHGHVHERG